MKSLFCIVPVLFSVVLYAQDLRQTEKELKARYVGKTLRVNQTVGAGELNYNAKGEPLGKPYSCGLPNVRIDAVKLTKRELTLSGRGPYSEVLFHRGPDLPEKAKKVIIRLQSDGEMWRLEDIVAAIQRMGSEIPLRWLPKSATLPKDASPAPPGTDPRVLYLLPTGPVFRAKDGIERPKAINMPDPEYTEAARQQKVCGSVGLAMVVNEDGSVDHVRAATTALGYGLDEQARATVAKWRFQPATLDGKPVKVEMEVTMSFRLY